MRKYKRSFATLAVALAMMGVIAGPASADTLVGVNVCDVSVLVENDSSSPNQCHNE